MKALILLLAFSASTVMGFACSIGINMGYNAHHHQMVMPVPQPGSNTHGCHQQHARRTNSTDDCCSHGVTNLALANKLIAQTVSPDQPAVFLLPLQSFFEGNIISEEQAGFVNNWPYVRLHHPPISDILLQVRSFRI